MPMVDLVDETFVVATPTALAACLHDRDRWPWWPELELVVSEDRGERGIRWTVTGALVGSSEVWLEPWGDGVIVHYYLRADLTKRGSATEIRPARAGRPARAAQAAGRRHSAQVKRCLFALKDELEQGRLPGTPRPTGGARAEAET